MCNVARAMLSMRKRFARLSVARRCGSRQSRRPSSRPCSRSTARASSERRSRRPPDRALAASATPKGRAKEVMDRQSDRLPRQTRCEGMRIKREIQMGASGGGQSIKASGHWPREQAGHKPATGMTIPSQNALDPRRASHQAPSSRVSCKPPVPQRRRLVFMDTTSPAFYGAGGDSLGAYGYSKDHRPDLKQMILAVVIDGEGQPICTEMLPGNTADARVLVPIVDRLRERFHVGRVCVVADRGMISAATIAALEERKLEYILGARERGSATIRHFVLEDEAPLTPLLVERARGETQLFVKEVKLGAARYVLCRNEAEAERERNERQAIVAGLAKQLARGDKALIGNSAYRRYLRRTPSASGKPGPAFEIDPGKLAEEARFAGVFVLRTNARITALQAVLRYRDLLQVEDLFRRAKAILRTRPIYHSSDAAIRGHVFCSFLALMLQKELADLCHSHGLVIEWADLLRDLDRLQEATIEKDGTAITARTAVAGQ